MTKESLNRPKLKRALEKQLKRLIVHLDTVAYSIGMVTTCLEALQGDLLPGERKNLIDIQAKVTGKEEQLGLLIFQRQYNDTEPRSETNTSQETS